MPASSIFRCMNPVAVKYVRVGGSPAFNRCQKKSQATMINSVDTYRAFHRGLCM